MFRTCGVVAVAGVLACAAVVGAGAVQPERLIMVTEGDKPAQKCRVIKCWNDKDGNKVCQVQAADSGEMMTIMEPTAGPSGPSGVVRVPGGSALTRVFRWGSKTKTPSIAPSAPADAVVVGMPQPASSPSNWDRLFASSRPRVTTQAKVTHVSPLDPSKPTVLSARVETPKAKAERESFGSVERIDDDEASRAAEKAAAKAETAQSKPVVTKVEAKQTVEDGNVKRLFTRAPETPVKTEPPKTLALPPRMEPVETKKPDARPVTVADKGDSAWTRMTGLKKPVPGSPDSPPKMSAAQMRRAASGGPGSESWNAAVSTPPPPPTSPFAISIPAKAGNAFTTPGPMPQQPAPVMTDAGVSTSLANAFTGGGTSRPIPSDMGQNYSLPNAMQGGGAMGGAERRPSLNQPNAYAYGYGYYPVPMPMMPYTQPMPMQMPVPSSIAQASMTVQTPPTTSAMQTLSGAVLPSERETAVDALVCCDWKKQPEVAEALTKAARTDPAATVRAACVRGLAKMKCNTVPVVSALAAMKNDGDLRVRQEVEQALATLMRP